MLEFPKEAQVDSVIPKKDFFEQTEMSSRDKNIFTNYIKQIKWLYSLQLETVNIKPYSDEEKDYEEIEVIQVILKKETEYLERIADLIHRGLPYPLIIIFKLNNKFLISVAHKRNSKQDYGKVTLTDMRYTPWISENFLDEFDEKLLDKLAIGNLNQGDFYKMYSSVVDVIILSNGSREIGREVTVPVEKVKEINNEIYYINQDIKEKKAELKKETQFNKKAEINMKIYSLKQAIENLRKELY